MKKLQQTYYKSLASLLVLFVFRQVGQFLRPEGEECKFYSFKPF